MDNFDRVRGFINALIVPKYSNIIECVCVKLDLEHDFILGGALVFKFTKYWTNNVLEFHDIMTILREDIKTLFMLLDIHEYDKYFFWVESDYSEIKKE